MMNDAENKTVVESVIKKKLIEMLGDRDDGLKIRKTIRDRLLHQQQAVAAGERGQLFDDVTQQLQLK